MASPPTAPPPTSSSVSNDALSPPLPDGEREPDDEHTTAVDTFVNEDSSSDEALLSLPTTAIVTTTSTTTASTVVDEPSSATSCEDESLCVVCFERAPETTLEPCGHANLCLICLSRLVKRRCPTCRARAKKVRVIDATGEAVVRTVRDVIADRKRAEMDVLSSTLQIVFLGPASVGKKALVRKLLAKYPLNPHMDEVDDEDLFSDGTDFAANAKMCGVEVRLSVLRRTSLVSRRMMLDDVRVLKPDVLVLCCSAQLQNTFEELQSWDRVLRSSFGRCRVWALLADDDDLAADAAEFHLRQSVPNTISGISPPELRPRGHYLCTRGPAFNIGFRALAKDVVEIARVARDEQYAVALAAEEVRNIAAHHAAGTLADQQHEASLVIANNGISVPAFAHVASGSIIASRAQTAETRPAEARAGGVGNRGAFALRGFRRDAHGGAGGTSTGASGGAAAAAGGAGGGNGNAFSFAGFVKWFSGASGSAQ